MSNKLKRVRTKGRNDLSDDSGFRDFEQDNVDNTGDTASRPPQVFGTRYLSPDSGVQYDSRKNKDSDAPKKAGEEEDSIVVEPQSSAIRVQTAQVLVEAPILTSEEKAKYVPLSASSIVNRILGLKHDEGGLQYRILFDDGHKEMVRGPSM